MTLNPNIVKLHEIWRRQGIHLGWGSPAKCVICDTPYPCDHLKEGSYEQQSNRSAQSA